MREEDLFMPKYPNKQAGLVTCEKDVGVISKFLFVGINVSGRKERKATYISLSTTDKCIHTYILRYVCVHSGSERAKPLLTYSCSQAISNKRHTYNHWIFITVYFLGNFMIKSKSKYQFYLLYV